MQDQEKKASLCGTVKKGKFMFRSSLFLCFCRIFKIEDQVFCSTSKTHFLTILYSTCFVLLPCSSWNYLRFLKQLQKLYLNLEATFAFQMITALYLRSWCYSQTDICDFLMNKLNFSVLACLSPFLFLLLPGCVRDFHSVPSS